MSVKDTKAEVRAYMETRERLADSLLDIVALEELGDEALTAVERRLSSLTETNCGWTIYMVRPALLQQVRSEIQHRKALRELADEPVEVVS